NGPGDGQTAVPMLEPYISPPRAGRITRSDNESGSAEKPGVVGRFASHYVPAEEILGKPRIAADFSKAGLGIRIGVRSIDETLARAPWSTVNAPHRAHVIVQVQAAVGAIA